MVWYVSAPTPATQAARTISPTAHSTPPTNPVFGIPIDQDDPIPIVVEVCMCASCERHAS